MYSVMGKSLAAIVLLIFLSSLSAHAQGSATTNLSGDLTGIWRGYFITDDGEQYKYELQVEQTKTHRISGVSYSYLDTRFYGKATLTGNFTSGSSSALIQEIKTVEVKMAGGSTACIMKCFFTYTRSGKEEFLEGTYTSTFEDSEPGMGIRRGGNCGSGKVFLRKVPTSDFYIEPFLRDKKIRKDSVISAPVEKPTVSKPPVKKPELPPVSKPPAAVTRKPEVKKPVVAKTPEKKQTVDTIARRKPQETIVIDKPIAKPISVPTVIRSRQNELVQTLTVSSEEILVRLYDNGEIDGDTISVYLDGKPLVSNKGLSTVPISLTVKLDEANPEHTLVMVAENMGRIPPNTSLMIVQDGDKRYQVGITSTEQKNAMVRFRYQKKSD